MTDQVQGPVQSAVTQLMQAFEAAMWSRGIAPETAMEVINVVLLGDYRGDSRGGKVTGIPGWADALAGQLLDITDRSVDARRKEHGIPGRDGFADDVRLVILALHRRVLKELPDTFEQVLAPQKD